MNVSQIAWTQGCNCTCNSETIYVTVPGDDDGNGGGNDNYIVGWELILLCAAIAIIFILVATLWITCNLNTFANIQPGGVQTSYDQGTQQTQPMSHDEETQDPTATEYHDVPSGVRSIDPRSSQQTLDINTDTHGSGTSKQGTHTNASGSGTTTRSTNGSGETTDISTKITTDKYTTSTGQTTHGTNTSVKSSGTPNQTITGSQMGDSHVVSLKGPDPSPVTHIDTNSPYSQPPPQLSRVYPSLKALPAIASIDKSLVTPFAKRRTLVLRTHADPSIRSRRDLLNSRDVNNTTHGLSGVPAHHLGPSSKSSHKLDIHPSSSNNPNNYHHNNNNNKKPQFSRNTSMTGSMLERSTNFRRHKQSFPELRGEFINVTKTHKFKTRKSHTQDDMFYDNFNDRYASDDEYQEIPFGDDYATVPRPSMSSAINQINLNKVRKNVSQLSVGSVNLMGNNPSNDSHKTGTGSTRSKTDLTVVVAGGSSVGGSVGGSIGGNDYQTVPYAYDLPEEKSVSQMSHTPQPKPAKLRKQHTKIMGKFELRTPEDFDKMSQIRMRKLQEPKKVNSSSIDWNQAEEIGHGSFGVVLRANYVGGRDDPSVVAVKKLHEKHLTSEQKKEFAREAKLMEHFGEHAHIVRFIGVCTFKDQLCIITEFAEHGSLWDCLMGKKSNDYIKILTVETKLEMVRQAAEGISHLHKEAVIHRDISARNFLIDSNFNIKVADLGMARLKSSHKSNNNNNNNKNDPNDIYSNVDDNKNDANDENSYDKTDNKFGPIRWLAPECIYAKDGLQYSEKTDVYAFGITLYEIFALKRPFYEIKKLPKVAFAIYNGDRPSIDDNEKIQRVGPGLTTLMRECWQENPKLRPNFESIIEDLKSIHSKYMSTYRNNKEFIQAIKYKIKNIQKQQQSQYIDTSPTNVAAVRQRWMSKTDNMKI